MYEKAIMFAAKYHEGQVDKQGKPYIFHVLAVADNFKEDKLLYVVACLHDIIEDTNCTLEEIQTEFGITVAHQVKALTKKPGQSYQEYIEALLPYTETKKVKIADIQHNLSRINDLESEKDKIRLRKKYTNALSVLMNISMEYFEQ